MSARSQDEAFSRYVLQTGVVRIEQLEAARDEQRRSNRSLSEILVALGALTPLQRQDLERRVQQGVGETPQQLGPYRLLCKLGEGGMGAVYLCEDTLLQRQVALKILAKDVTDSPESLSRFRREAMAAGKLNHAGIAMAYATGEDAGRHFYAMEYCRGESLDKVLKRLGRLPERKIVETMRAVAQAMQYAHERGIVHRDLKPGNVMLGLDGSVKVLDLGLSKNVLDREQSYQTTSGLAIGTPHYISPEQARGDKEVDGRSDVYSLGATMYHLATGRTPYEGATAAAIMTRHLHDPVPDPRAANPELSEGFSRVVRMALSKAPADRYASMGELAADLERLSKGQPVVALSKRRRPRRGSRGGRSWRLVVGTVLAAVLAGIAIFLYRWETRRGGSVASEARDVERPQPQLPSSEERAQAALARLFDGLAAEDRAGRVARLGSFLEEHGGTQVGAQARALLREIERNAAADAEVARWKPLFDGRSIDCLVEGNRPHWLVEDGLLTHRPGATDCAQTRRDFEDGAVRIRFTVADATYLRFTIRQGREGGYSAIFDRRALARMQGDQDLIFDCRGARVTATLNGRPQPVEARGAPRSGRLHFGVSEGRLRIRAIEFAEPSADGAALDKARNVE